MKSKKSKKTAQPQTSAAEVAVNNQPASQGDEHKSEVASPEPEMQQPAVVETAPVGKKEKAIPPVKEKAPSISASVRRIVVRRPELTFAEVSQTLIDDGWDAGDVEKRKSTIATLRTDALAIIVLAKEAGWTTPQGKN